MLDDGKLTFLVVDNTESDRELLRHHVVGVRRHETNCLVCSDVREAAGLIRGELVDILLLEYAQAVENDFDAISTLRELAPEMYVVILTADKDERVNARMIRAGANDHLAKGTLSSITFEQMLDRAVSKLRMERDRRLTQTSLKLSEQNYRKLIDNIPDIMLVHRDGKILFINKAAKTVLGYEEEKVIGKSILSFVPNDQDKTTVVMNMRRRAKGEDVPDYEVDIVDQRGTIHTVIVRASSTMFNNEPAFQVVLINITVRKKMEEELLKARKLESIGLLAGGIAHDFNNILTGIIAGIATAKLKTLEHPELTDILNEIEGASFKASELTRQLLTFSKGGEPVKMPTRVKNLMEESLKFSLKGTRVDYITDLPDSLFKVDIDRSQIGQVMSNLIINACHAMPGGGTIHVSGRNVVSGDVEVPDGVPVTSMPDTVPLQPGLYVEISITDDGAGISKDNLQRIFDPYFTTKQKGNGLGLATVYSILQRHSGYVTVESKEGKGSTFVFYLPAATEAKATDAVENMQDSSRNKNILVMDDDTTIRNTLERFLKSIGYGVTSVPEGSKAVDLYSDAINANRPFLVGILDLTIPGGIGGAETAERILKVDPNAKLIAISGYSNDPILSSFRRHGFSGVLCKPFRPEDLTRLLNDLSSAAEGTKDFE